MNFSSFSLANQKSKHTLRKFITQLTLLSQLRKLDEYVKQIANSMPITIDLRENALVKDLIAEVQAEWELEHGEKLKAIEQIAENEKAERLQAEQIAEKAGLEAEKAGQIAEKAGLEAEKAGQIAEKAGQIAEKAGLEAEAERQRINSMILSLYQEFQMPMEQIARMANKELAYVEDLIAKAEEGKK